MCIVPLTIYRKEVCLLEQVYRVIQTLLTYSFFLTLMPSLSSCIPRLSLVYPCSLMVRIRLRMVGSKVESVFIRLSIRWQACITVV